MDELKEFVSHLKEILKGNVPTDFYEMRERLNARIAKYRGEDELPQAIIDATDETVYLTSRTAIHDYLGSDRKERLSRLKQFIEYQKAA